MPFAVPTVMTPFLVGAGRSKVLLIAARCLLMQLFSASQTVAACAVPSHGRQPTVPLALLAVGGRATICVMRAVSPAGGQWKVVVDGSLADDVLPALDRQLRMTNNFGEVWRLGSTFSSYCLDSQEWLGHKHVDAINMYTSVHFPSSFLLCWELGLAVI